MITIPEFKERFPEFKSVSDDKINLFISDAILEMGSDESRWLGFYDVAISYLVAHLLEIAGGVGLGNGTPPMPIKKSDVDGVLVELSTDFLSGKGELYSTSYGIRYARYRKMVFAGGRVGWSSLEVS